MNARRIGVGAAIVSLCALPQEAFVSRIVFKDVSVEEVASAAQVIVQATYRQTLKKTKAGGSAFEVTGVWTAHTDKPVTGDRIRVWQRSAEAWGMALKFAEQDGVRRSPLVSALRPASALTPGAAYVLFLHPGVRSGEYVFEAQDGFIAAGEFEALRNDLPKLRWQGRAANAKAGAIVQLEPFGPIYLDGTASFPEEIVGKEISVSGLLVRRKHTADPVHRGAKASGSEGLQWVFERPIWSLAQGWGDKVAGSRASMGELDTFAGCLFERVDDACLTLAIADASCILTIDLHSRACIAPGLRELGERRAALDRLPGVGGLTGLDSDGEIEAHLRTIAWDNEQDEAIPVAVRSDFGELVAIGLERPDGPSSSRERCGELIVARRALRLPRRVRMRADVVGKRTGATSGGYQEAPEHSPSRVFSECCHRDVRLGQDFV
jgi:hypothetical protein